MCHINIILNSNQEDKEPYYEELFKFYVGCVTAGLTSGHKKLLAQFKDEELFAWMRVGINQWYVS